MNIIWNSSIIIKFTRIPKPKQYIYWTKPSSLCTNCLFFQLKYIYNVHIRPLFAHKRVICKIIFKPWFHSLRIRNFPFIIHYLTSTYLFCIKNLYKIWIQIINNVLWVFSYYFWWTFGGGFIVWLWNYKMYLISHKKHIAIFL